MAGIKGRSGGYRPGAGRKRTKEPVVRGPRGGARPGAGRHPFVPTSEQHNVVEKAAAFGLTVDQICLLVINPETNKPISQPLLYQCFKEDLDRGHPKAILTVANALYRNAVQRNNVAAQIFYLKTRGKWREGMDITVRRPEDMTDEELDAAITAAIGDEPTGEGSALAQLATTGESPTRH